MSVIFYSSYTYSLKAYCPQEYPVEPQDMHTTMTFLRFEKGSFYTCHFLNSLCTSLSPFIFFVLHFLLPSHQISVKFSCCFVFLFTRSAVSSFSICWISRFSKSAFAMDFFLVSLSSWRNFEADIFPSILLTHPIPTPLSTTLSAPPLFGLCYYMDCSLLFLMVVILLLTFEPLLWGFPTSYHFWRSPQRGLSLGTGSQAVRQRLSMFLVSRLINLWCHRGSLIQVAGEVCPAGLAEHERFW